jgi:hypothetical protein
VCSFGFSLSGTNGAGPGGLGASMGNCDMLNRSGEVALCTRIKTYCATVYASFGPTVSPWDPWWPTWETGQQIRACLDKMMMMNFDGQAVCARPHTRRHLPVTLIGRCTCSRRSGQW